MVQWFESLSEVAKIYAVIAIPSTVILILQTILLLFGIGSGDGDADVDTDGADSAPELDGDGGLTLFSIRGIMAFLCVGGWSGMLLSDSGVTTPITVLLSLIFGIIALFAIALLMKGFMKLQSSGNIDISNAIGKVGQVYIPIPANKKGRGKINIVIQEKYTEVAAITNDPETIKTGESVRVVSTDGIDLFVVERI